MPQTDEIVKSKSKAVSRGGAEDAEEKSLFGGESFDKLKALSKVEGMPPNKKVSISQCKAHDRHHSHQTDRS